MHTLTHLLKLELKFFLKCLNVGVGGSGTNNEIVGKRCNLLNFNNLNITCKLFIKSAYNFFFLYFLLEFDDFLLSGDDIVFYNRSACLMMSLGGQLKFNSPLEGKDIVKIMPAGEKDKLMVLEKEAVSTIQLIRTKEE